MKVQRIVTNVETPDPGLAWWFYGEVLGLEIVMDHGWIVTYGADATMKVQASFASQGGADTPVPALSIEVDDVEEALARVRDAGFPIEYGPVDEPWGVRRSLPGIRSASSSTSCHIDSKCG